MKIRQEESRAESDARVRRVTLEIAARAGVDVRTAARAVLHGPDVLRSTTNRARVTAAARDLGVPLPLIAA